MNELFKTMKSIKTMESIKTMNSKPTVTDEVTFNANSTAFSIFSNVNNKSFQFCEGVETNSTLVIIQFVPQDPNIPLNSVD